MNRSVFSFTRLVFVLLLLVTAGTGSQTAQAQELTLNAPACVDFESLPASASYAVGDVFIDSGTVISALPFTWSNGTVTFDGNANVNSGNLAGGSGQDIGTNNINLGFDFGQPLTGLQFAFGEYGGNLNIEINGDFRNFNNFTDIDGTLIGGVNVAVTNGLGNDFGTVTLLGQIDQFAVGGQELWIDSICPESNCLDFESLTPGTTYNVGDTFNDSGYQVTLEEFVWSNGTATSTGFAQVDVAGSIGGWGLNLETNNINAVIDFGHELSGLSFDFGEFGGNLNIEINGDFRNFNNFADINAALIGNVAVRVINGLGNDRGQVHLTGPLSTLKIGGQELWLDNFCPEGRCIDFESLPAHALYSVGDIFVDSGIEIEVLPFTWSSGIATSAGSATVDVLGLAGGTGQDLNTNNANVAFHFGDSPPLKGLTLHFGAYGGNLNIEINGDFQNFNDFADIDGTVIGGVDVSVINSTGSNLGFLELSGMIYQFAIGGQELWIDDICPTPAIQTYLPIIAK